jgi:hypothetical protein
VAVLAVRLLIVQVVDDAYVGGCLIRRGFVACMAKAALDVGMHIGVPGSVA